MARIKSRKLGDAERKDLKGLKMSEWDRQNIAKLIRFYDLAFPGVRKQVIKEGRDEVLSQHQVQKSRKVGGLDLTRRAAIPEGLLQALKEGYPSIIVDRNQFEQFLRWFPEHDLWRK